MFRFFLENIIVSTNRSFPNKQIVHDPLNFLRIVLFLTAEYTSARIGQFVQQQTGADTRRTQPNTTSIEPAYMDQ